MAAPPRQRPKQIQPFSRARPALVLLWPGSCYFIVMMIATTSARNLMARLLGGALLALLLTPTLSNAATLPAPKPLAPEAKRCAEAIHRAEAQHHIPSQLLAAVGVAESGRWMGPEQASFAWPWAVTSGRRSWFFPTREAAITHTRHLQALNTTNIDVGCMQVNLGYHGHAFATLEDAFNPETNVAYAAKFLSKLHKARRSWALAVGLYHSANRPRQNHYKRKVMALWNKLRRRAAEVHRLNVQARFAEKRQANHMKQRKNVTLSQATR
jgi:hypothetical protein